MATMVTIRPAPRTRNRALPIAITALVAATALTHLFMGVMFASIATQPAAAAAMSGEVAVLAFMVLFSLNAAGYAILNVAHYLPALRRIRRLTRFALIGFAALTIVAYFAAAQGNFLSAFGLADKAIEVALIALLVIEDRRRR
ncbi:MAG: hypothetical protein WAM30_16115 [Candidatus Dormiibacterota bacterium]